MRLLLIFFSLCLPLCAFSQVVKSVVLDSVVVQAVKRGFDVEDFVEMVKSDTSFLKGFRNLRTNPHHITGVLNVYDKKGRVQASRKRAGRQLVDNGRRWIRIDEESVSGKFYGRNGIPKLYTATLFDELFFYTDTPSVKTQATAASDEGSSNIGKLKQLVFNPGSNIGGVPFIGNRMAVFDDEMADYYHYAIRAEMIHDSLPCYVFSVQAKSGYADDLVVKSMNTWFNRRTFEIVYRDYVVSFNAPVFDFDVRMKITMEYENDLLYPGRIEYSGYWDLPLKKQERADFDLRFKIE